jgi:hypothetical protein
MKIKLLIKTTYAVALAAVACFTIRKASAQENSIGELMASWASNSQINGGGAPPAPFAPAQFDANLVIGSLKKGSGIGAITTTGVYGGANWTNAGIADSEANSIANGLYLTYTVQGNPGYTISFTTNILFFHNSATGPINGELQYSTDGINYTDIATMTYSATHTAQTTSLTNVLSGIPALQNVPSTTTNFFRIVNWGATGTAGTWYINNASPVTMPDFQVIGNVSSTGVAPFNPVVTPASIATNAGSTAAFTVTAQGDTPSYFWYKNSAANLVAGATTATLTLPNVTGTDAASYFVVLSNATGMATSSAVSLTVNDPFITSQPVSTFGLLDGSAQFSVTGAGTSPAYQWYFANSSGTIVAPVANGTQASGSVISGAASSILQIANLHPADPTNFVVVVNNTFNSVTSSVVSLLGVGTHEPLVFWNFNQTNFPSHLASPAPWFGVGTASPVGSCNLPGTSPFAGSVDPFDGPGFGLGSTNFSWGTDNYPLNGSNKLNGVQFLVSTVGAQNITVSYDSRVSATASDFERVQYTIDGTTWIDYPSSSTFGGVGTTYIPYTNNLTGFPGAANNPNFGIRIVTETQNTATYGISANANYLGTANTYGTAGTVTYDVVTIYGDSITQPYAPPTISSIPNTNSADNVPLRLDFTVSDPATPPDSLTYSAVSLNPSTVNPPLTFGGSGANRTLTIGASSTPDSVDAAPILITVTDANGFSAATWFDLTLTSPNLPPTNSLTSLTATGTNVLANGSLALSFKVTDDRTPTNGQSFSYSATSANSTVVPAANIVVPASSPSSNATVTITPAANQLGMAQIGVTVNDNDLLDPKSTTANIALMVRPNTNVVMIDYFNYDNGESLDTAASNVWKHLSGTVGQMPVNVAPTGGSVDVDTLDNTENLQAALVGAPYKTNSGATLYSSFVVNMDSTKMPIGNGTYFILFNDGSGVTGNYEGRVIAATNGAAPGFYRLGIVNFGADATDAQMFQQDLSPNSNYVVVTSLVLSNGFSSLWVNPSSQSSRSVTDTSPAPSQANLFNISDIELRESGGNGGSVNVSFLKVGTTFDSVFPSLHIQETGTSTVLIWSDPTLGIQAATNAVGPYVDLPGIASPYTNTSSSATTFYRFGH